MGKPSKHGWTGTREHQIWLDMHQRCSNPKSERYDRYGARGITVCEQWSGANGFINFIADMGKRPTSAHSIDRRDNDGNYESSNCRWATRDEQNANKSTCRILEYRGRRQTAAAWARELGINKQTLLARLWAGQSVAQALETPVAKRVWTKSPGRPGPRAKIEANR